MKKRSKKQIADELAKLYRLRGKVLNPSGLEMMIGVLEGDVTLAQIEADKKEMLESIEALEVLAETARSWMDGGSVSPLSEGWSLKK